MRRVKTHFEYDPLLDDVTWKGYNPKKMARIKKARGDPESLAMQLARYHNAKRLIKHHDTFHKTHAAIKERREEAENRLAETLRLCVNALENGLTELNEIGHPQISWQQFVNQQQIHNAIFFLKTKCGVKFSMTDGIIKSVQVDRSHLKEGYKPYWERKREENDE